MSESKNILPDQGFFVGEDGSIEAAGDAYVDYGAGSEAVILDGTFSLNDLKFVINHIERMGKSDE